MRSQFNIVLFVDRNDKNPVLDYILQDGRTETDLAILIGAIQRLSRIGQSVIDTKMAKRIKGYDFFELRKDRHRIMYAQDKQCFVLLSAFLKESENTPLEQLDRAKKNWEEYQRLGKCQPYKIPSDF